MFRKYIAFMLAFSMFVGTNLSSKFEPIIEETVALIEIREFPKNYIPIYTEYKSEEAEEYLWNTVNKYSPSEIITAGILGYFKRESEFKSTAVAGWARTLAVYGEDHCVIFTEAIDEGLLTEETREKFITECQFKYGGYGLGQWSSTEYCDDLYSFASATRRSIGDAEMQCEFVILSMMRNEYLWEKLNECDSPRRAGELIALLYDGSQSAMDYTAIMATHYYNKYAKV